MKAAGEIEAVGTEPAPAMFVDPGMRECVPHLIPDLQRFFYRRAPREQVDDLVQETCLALIMRNSNTIRNIRNYAFVVGAHLLIAHARRSVRERNAREEFTQTLLLDTPPVADELFMSTQTCQALLEAVRRLPPRSREVFWLSRNDGLTYQEIARQLGISESAVEKAMMRALDALRTAMAAHL